jgi:acetoin utilization protein AcuB
MDIRAAMTSKVVTVTPADSLEDAAALMRRGRFRHLPVVRDGVLQGVVTERDLQLQEGGLPSDDMRQRSVRSVMSADVITIGPSDPIEEAARLMLENKVGCLPVVEGNDLVGIVTESDIFRAFVNVLGVMEPGTRIQVHTTDLAAALEAVGAVARSQRVRIIAVASEMSDSERAQLVVRFSTPLIAQLTGALRARGLEIVGPDPGDVGGKP